MVYRDLKIYESRHNSYKDDTSGAILLESAVSVAVIIFVLLVLM